MVISAVGWPLRSIRALVTTVVACTTTPSTASAVMPAFAKVRSTLRKKPSSKSWWVVSVLSTNSEPSEPRSTASVKVPPMSTARE